jgi:hypothetical protein
LKVVNPFYVTMRRTEGLKVVNPFYVTMRRTEGDERAHANTRAALR